jgi:hypothetical protein
MLLPTSASGRPAKLDPNQGDAPIFRQITAMAVADRRQIAAWCAALRGTAQVLCWQSVELRERAISAKVRARALCQQSVIAQAGAQALRPQSQPREPVNTRCGRSPGDNDALLGLSGCQQDGHVTAPGHPERGPPQGSP